MATDTSGGRTIFLCYAREDIEEVQNIYQKLKEENFQPWMDTPPDEYFDEGLEPGA